MKATKEYISSETAKLLKDCGVESKYWYGKDKNFKYKVDTKRNLGKFGYYSINNKSHNVRSRGAEIRIYTWQEILWEYPEEFFGDVYNSNREYLIKDVIGNKIFLLQQKRYEEADLSFRRNCILINKS